MHRVILPFALGSNKNKKAVSEATFSVDSQIQNFSRITVGRLKFMKLYDEEKFNLSQYPFSVYWGQSATLINTSRAAASVDPSSSAFNQIQFGHPHCKELRSMDDMPHIVEISIKNLTKNRDNVSSKRVKLGEHQTIDTEKEEWGDTPSKIQSLLVYNTNIRLDEISGAYAGAISCDMKDLGMFNVKDKGFGDTFTVELSMYNYRGLALSHVPSCELTLLFR